jgi:hypothetical protein
MALNTISTLSTKKMIDIDVPTLAVSTVILLGVLTPFVTYSIKSRKARNKFLNGYNEFTRRMNLTIDIQEDWRNRYIFGLDKTKGVLTYYQAGESSIEKYIPLDEVSKAVIHQTYLNGEDGSSAKKALDQIELQIHFKNAGKKTMYLEIYKHENYSDLLGETILAAKWAELINQSLTK